MTKFFKQFLSNESGATAIEYALIAAVMAVALVAGAGPLAQAIQDKFGVIAADLH
jgi:pilus assembly protein Flp/PilA